MKKCLEKKDYAFIKCKHSNNNQIWIGSQKMWGKSPLDLMVHILRIFINPITGTFNKDDRNVSVNNHKLLLSFVQNSKNVNSVDEAKANLDEAKSNTNNLQRQFADVETLESSYKLYGVANHQGGAHSGHYTNHILNDSKGNLQGKWIHTNSLSVIPHNRDASISANVVSCWFHLDVDE